jgi:hypothetical protein
MSQPSWPATARAVLLVLLMAPAASASIGLPLTLEGLTARADLIVLGRVTRVESGADAQLNGVYTYVTLEPAEVFKGQVAEGPLVVKQQGGVFGTRGVYVHGQATFAEGELVLLFLGTRLTDGSRFTPSPLSRRRQNESPNRRSSSSVIRSNSCGATFRGWWRETG